MSLGVKEMITPILKSCVPLGRIAQARLICVTGINAAGGRWTTGIASCSRIAMVCDILLLNQQVKG